MNIKQLLIERTQYKGKKEPNTKYISASELGDEPLKVWLRQQYGVIENTDFDQATIGSLLHIGIQEILKDIYITEYQLETILPNGWGLTGSIDLLNIKNKEIIDIKVTKSYTIESVFKNTNHQYIWQLSAYRYLCYKHFGFDFDTKLLFILKDGGFDFKTMRKIESIEIIDIQPKSYVEVERKHNEMVEILERNTIPEQCSDVWYRKTQAGSIPMKCKTYCVYSNVCKYYKPNPMKINF